MLNICFGTDTGTALELSQGIQREAARYDVQCRLFDGALYSTIKDLSFLFEADGAPTVFILSTCGQGQLPPSWTSLWTSILVRSLPADLLAGCAPVAFLGLGDSSYPHFNFAAKKLRRRLLNLGARELCEPCWADASAISGTWGSCRSWQLQLWPGRIARLPPYTQQLPPPRVSVVFGGDTARSSPSLEWTRARVTSCTLLSAEPHWQIVRHVEMTAGADLAYCPGDVLQVLPEAPMLPQQQQRSASECVDPRVLRGRSCRWAGRVGVQRAAQVLQLPPLDSVVSVSGAFPGGSCVEFPAPLRLVLSRCVDLEAPVTRWALTCIAALAKEEREKQRLLELLGSDDALDEWAAREGRSLVETVQEFPSCLPLPLERVLEMAPPLLPRSFSMAGFSPDPLSLCVSSLRWVSPLGRVRTGLCSGLLEGAAPDTALLVRIRPSSVRAHPSWATQDLLLVCCGSGAALARSFMRAKRCWGGAGRWALLAGHRGEAQDALYAREFLQAVEQGVLEQYTPAYSRGEPPRRVPQVLRQRGGSWGDRAFSVMTGDSGRLVVSGRAGSMPRDVREALVQVLQQRIPGCTEQSALQHIKVLEAKKRLYWEVWG